MVTYLVVRMRLDTMKFDVPARPLYDEQTDTHGGRYGPLHRSA